MKFKKNHLKFIVLFFVTAFSVFTLFYSANAEDIKQPYLVGHNIKITKGWNLLINTDFNPYPYNPENTTKEGDISKDDILVRYNWLNPLNKYIRGDKDISKKDQKKMAELKNQLGVDAEFYTSNNASFVYFKKSGTFTASKYKGVNNSYISASPYHRVKLFKGWNLKYIDQWMVSNEGRSIDDFKGNCTVEKLYLYDGENGDWQSYLQSKFTDEMVFRGFAIKVSDNCEFNNPQT